MKLMYPLLSVSPVAILAGLLLIPSGSQAAQMAYEGFDYPTGTGNLTTLAGGTGWNGAWQTVNNGSADVVAGSLAAGGSSPAGLDARSTGNSVNLPNNRRVGRLLDTSANGPFAANGYRDANGRIGADGTTLYLSFMQQPNSAGVYYEFEFHRDNLGDPGRIGGIGNDSTSPGGNVNLRAGGANNYSLGAGTTAVNFYVVRIDFKAGNDDVHVYRNPTSATEPGSPTLTKLAVGDMSFNGVSFGAFVGAPTTVAHDELRFGQAWADVIDPPLAIPVFATQPQSSTIGMAGGNFGLSAVANGYPTPTYQWYKGTDALVGQTSSTLSLSSIQASDAGSYHVVATNSQGNKSSNTVTLTVNPSPAGLLAYEGFRYDAGTVKLQGKNGGLGWSAAWASVDGGGGTVSAGSLAAGTNGPNGYDAQSSGNAEFTPNAKRDGRLLDTSPTGRFGAAGYLDGNGNIGANDKTVYISFLQQPDGATKFYEFEFHRGNLGDPGRIGGLGNDTNNANVGLRAGGSTVTIGPGNTAVNFYVIRIDFRDGNDDVFVYQNPISGTEPGFPTLARYGVSDMSFNGISLAAFDNGRTVKHDEIRLGQAWEDVVFGSSRRELTWVGNGTTNLWNTTAKNWADNINGIASIAFSNGDPVAFDDTGSVTPAIGIPDNVSTSTILFDNYDKNYTLGGAGAINASGSLTKSGTGGVTLNGSANFGAAMIVNGGSLTLNGTTAVGGDLNVGAEATAVTLGGTNAFTGSLNAAGGTQTLSGTTSFNGFVSANGATTISGATTITGTGGTNLWIGNAGGSNASLTIEPTGSLTMTGVFNDALVFGRDGGSAAVTQNGGTVTYNPSNRDSAYIGASANNTLTTASYTMNGGTLEMGNMRLGLSIGPIVSNLNQGGGTINVKQLDLGSILTTGTGNYTMTGGTLNIGSAGITTSSNLYAISLANGTIGAAADWSSSLGMTLAGPMTFNTGVNKITLDGFLTGTGGITKTGNGILVLTGSNDYTGTTTVSAGTIAGYGTGSGSALTVASGAVIEPGVPGGVGTNVGVFTSDNSVTLTSGSTLKVEIDSTLDLVDQLLVSGALNITGANLVLGEVGSGTLPPATTFVVAESLTSALTGTFAGHPEGSSLTAGGNTFIIHYTTSQVTLTTGAGSAYSTWASSRGLDGSPGKEAGFNADPENDGIANGLEWILGGNPLAVGGSPLVTSIGSATTGLMLGFTREETSIGNADLLLQWDSDLDGTWTDVVITQTGGTYANGVVVTVNEAATPDTVTVQIPASNGPAGKVFARLKAVSH